MKVLRTIVVVSVVCGFGLGLRADAATSTLVNGIQGIVHDSVITYQQVRETLDVPTLARQYGNQPELFNKKLTEALNDRMEQLIQRQLILHEFKTAGYNLPESIIEERIQEYVRRKYGDRATMTRTLQAQGNTYEKLRQQVRDGIIIEALHAKNISSEIMISPHKIEAYYVEHKDDYRIADQIRMRLIVLNKKSPDDKEARQMAEEVLGKIKEGATFSEMASVYSQDSYRGQGGDRGWVDRSAYRKELADVAFTLKPGEPSGVIELPEACYLMLVEEIRPAHIKELADAAVRDEIERTLKGLEQDRLQKNWIDRLKKKTFIRLF